MDLSKLTVLLVEDDPLTAHLQTNLLNKNGLKVIPVESGEDALEFLEYNYKKINLILMDINLGNGKIPGTDYAELIISKFNKPLIFLSSHTEKEIIDKVEGINSYGFVVKNTGSALLIATIKVALKQFETNQKLLSLNTEITNKLKKTNNLVTAIDDIILEINRDFDVTNLWSKDEKLLLKPSQKILNFNLSEIMQPHLLEKVKYYCNDVFLNQKPLEFEYILDVPGGLKWFRARVNPVFDEFRNCNSLVVVIREITESKNSHIRLKDRIDFSMESFESLDDAALIYDLSGKIIRANQSICYILGFNSDEILKKKFYELSENKNNILDSEKLDLLKLNKSVVVEDLFICKDGSFINVEIHSELLEDQNVFSVIKNITDRKILQEEMFSKVFEHSPLAVCFSCLQEGKFISINKKFQELTGFNEEEIIGKTPIDLGFFQNDEEKNEFLEKTLSGFFKNKIREGKIVTKEKNVLNTLFHSLPVEILGEKYLLSFFIDITNQKRIENELLDSQRLLKAAMKMNKVGGWSLDLENNELFWTEEVYEIHELPLEYNPSIDEALKFYTESSIRIIKNALNELRSFGRPYDLELEITSAKNKKVKVRTIGEPIFDNGKIVKIFGTFQDISEQKEVEESLFKSEKLYRVTTEISPVGIFRTNNKGECVFVNSKWLEFSGLQYSEALGSGWVKALHPEDKDRIFSEWMNAVNELEKFYSELRFVTPEGKIYWLLAEAREEKNEKGDIVGFVGSITDITGKKIAEKRIDELLKEKELLLKEIHHRIKNNIASISGLLSLQANSTNN
ncbi:MAG: PAS domain S-box protein, partial [Leptospiraceae bacterium]|nr:PAS domain S-box protein [Leptospiraceae bacterium]